MDNTIRIGLKLLFYWRCLYNENIKHIAENSPASLLGYSAEEILKGGNTKGEHLLLFTLL
jgi:hypothetical protein